MSVQVRSRLDFAQALSPVGARDRKLRHDLAQFEAPFSGLNIVLSAVVAAWRCLRSIPAPTKLYRPIVSVVAALSKRNDSFERALPKVNQDPSPGAFRGH